jgi:hypothetical protein
MMLKHIKSIGASCLAAGLLLFTSQPSPAAPSYPQHYGAVQYFQVLHEPGEDVVIFSVAGNGRWVLLGQIVGKNAETVLDSGSDSPGQNEVFLFSAPAGTYSDFEIRLLP